MSGPHALWDADRPSPARRRRVTLRKTMEEIAAAASCSLGALHNLEVRGHGSPALWRRLAQALGVAVEEIKPREPGDQRQLELAELIPDTGMVHRTILPPVDAATGTR